jgi:hypothetical protein
MTPHPHHQAPAAYVTLILDETGSMQPKGDQP